MDQWIDGRRNARTDGLMDRCTDEWIDRWDEWDDGWLKAQLGG